MGNRPAGRAAVLLVLAALVAACGGGTAPSPPPVPPATPQAWTEAVCAALVPVVARLTAAPGLDLRAPEATRQAYLVYLADGLVVTDRARAALAAAGPAPVPDGDVVAEQVRGNLADLRADVADARSQVERTDPTSAVSVGRALVGGGRLVAALLNSAQVAGTVTRDPTLAAAYAQAPSCALLQRSGSLAPTSPPPPPSPTVEPTR